MRKILTFLCLIFMFFITFQAYTQAPVKIWDKTLGSGGADNASSMVRTSDGGFVIAGYSLGGITGDKSEASRGDHDFWIVKINSAGQKVWDKTIGGSNWDQAAAIITTSDGGYLVAGYSYSGISGDKTEVNKGIRDYWVVKLNSSGQIVWDKTLGGSGEDLAYAITESSDGGFVIAGGSASGISVDKSEVSRGSTDYWIVKLDNLGQKVWDKTIGGDGFDLPNSIIETSDGGFVIAGYSQSFIAGDKSEANKGSDDYWIVKLNSLGQKVWDKTIGGSGSEGASSIVETSDNGLVISGSSFSGISGDKTEVSRGFDDYWIVKLNSLGQKIWDKTIGGNGRDNSISIISSTDGGFIIAGYSVSGISGDKSEASKGNNDYWTVKLNSLGQKIWDKTIGTIGTDYAQGCATSTDGGYVIAGYTTSSGISGDKTEASKGGSDYWIVKLQEPCPTFPGNIAYINTNATGANSGVDWANAFTSLESALSAARTCPITQIWVAQGTYKPSAYPTVITGSPTLTNRDFTFELVDGVGIYGGFVGTETALTQRVAGNTTILSGDIGSVGSNTDNCYHVILSLSHSMVCRLDGLTITGGNANGTITISGVSQDVGGGLYNKTSSPNITNVIFYSNSSSGGGSGVVNFNSNSSSLSNVIFLENSTLTGGAGMLNSNCPLVNLSNVVFSNNTAGNAGGGLYNYNSSPKLTNVVFSKNVVSTGLLGGAGIYNVNSPVVIKNSIFWGNQITGNPTAASSDISNSSIGGISIITTSFTSMQLANNTTNYPTANFPNIGTSNNLFSQNPLFINDTDPDGADNIFMTPDDGLSLQSASPCKDAGTSTGASTTDITGAARVGNVDMGAYEFQGLCTTIAGSVGSDATVCSGANSGTLTLTGHTGSILRWESSIDNFVTIVTIANTTTTQNYSNLTQTTKYRAVVQNGTCASANSGTATITVGSGTVAGTVGTDASVCSGSNSGTLTLTGHTGSILRWESSIDNFVTIVSIANTTTTQNYSNLTQTTKYRAVVQNGTCTSANSIPATITVGSGTVAGTVGTDASVCSGSNSGTLTLTGHTGSILRWESSIDNFVTIVTIANTTTTQNYSNLTQITKYRAVVQNGTCASANSGTATITVGSGTVGGSVGSDIAVCTGSNSGTLTLTGQIGTILRWESSTDNFATIVTIANTTTLQSFINLTQTTKYRVVVQNGICTVANSAPATITILSPNAPVATGANIFLGGSVTLTATGCTGAGFALIWFTTIGDVPVTMPVSPTFNTQYYSKCQQTLGATVCTSAKSNDVTVTVSPAPIVTVIYVNQANLNPTQDGLTWATSYENLQSGLSSASAGVEVWVAKGTYKPTTTNTRTVAFELPSGVKMYGGFIGTEVASSQRDFKVNETILSGDIGIVGTYTDDSYHVLKIINANNQTFVDGFSIKYGYAANQPPVSSNNLSGSSLSPVSIESGGAIYIQSGNPTVSNCIIQNNFAIFGAGIYCEDGSIANINACIISGNFATFGGGVYVLNSNTNFYNDLITGNKGLGGGMYINHCNPILYNLTIASNDGAVGGMYNTPNPGVESYPVIKNSILWNNSNSSIVGKLSTITYSIIQGGYSGIGNRNLDPKFFSPNAPNLSPTTSGNYQVMNISPAIDGGNNGTISLTDKDLINNLRIYNAGIIDMGTYEFQGSRIGGTITSIISGDWDKGSTWDSGISPLAGDNVIINNNHTVKILETGTAKNVEIKTNAKLIHSSTSSKLQVGI
jgi:hypothetical protein